MTTAAERKKDLKEFAFKEYGIELDGRMSETDMAKAIDDAAQKVYQESESIASGSQNETPEPQEAQQEPKKEEVHIVATETKKDEDSLPPEESAQSYANRMWAGQSPDLDEGTRKWRIMTALKNLKYPKEEIESVSYLNG